MKTRKEILSQPFVNISDIKSLLMIPRDKAKEIYQRCDEEESKKEYRAHLNKVPLQSALKMAGVSYAFLQKQIH
jgi:hypothetical protein